MIFTPLLFFFETHFPRISPKAYEKSLSICKAFRRQQESSRASLSKKGQPFPLSPLIVSYVSSFVVTTGHEYFIC